MNRASCVCPVCNGTKRAPSTRTYLRDYDAETGTAPCYNCGTQYMFGQATGWVAANKQGDPCKHKYNGREVGRCLTEYVCEHCGDRFQIDSGD